MQPSTCRLRRALGRSDLCAWEHCPFWEDGGVVLEGGCALQRILPASDWTPELARRWLDLRQSLQRPGAARPGTRSLFRMLLDPELAER